MKDQAAGKVTAWWQGGGLVSSYVVASSTACTTFKVLQYLHQSQDAAVLLLQTTCKTLQTGSPLQSWLWSYGWQEVWPPVYRLPPHSTTLQVAACRLAAQHRDRDMPPASIGEEYLAAAALQSIALAGSS